MEVLHDRQPMSNLRPLIILTIETLRLIHEIIHLTYTMYTVGRIVLYYQDYDRILLQIFLNIHDIGGSII